jgi:hypothetical protein
MIEPGTLARYRANAAGFQNRAVFEIPGMLEKILEEARGGKSPDSTLLADKLA